MPVLSSTDQYQADPFFMCFRLYKSTWEAEESFPLDRALAPSSLKTRNIHWNHFVNWCDYHGVWPPISLANFMDWGQTLKEKQRGKDYVCTVKCRGLQIQMFLQAELLSRAQTRLGHMFNADPPHKAHPVLPAMIRGLTEREWAMLHFWVNAGGLRVGSFLHVIPNTLPSREELICSPGSYGKFIPFVSGEDKTRKFVHYVPKLVLADCYAVTTSALFPVRRGEIDDLMKKLRPSTPHGVRRTFALAARLELHGLGWSTVKQIKDQATFLMRINLLAGWSSTSLSFFEYTKDFLNFKNYTSFYALRKEVMEYILTGC